ncbi:hypothetical protein RKE29_28530 [Streptomyces sp. B1866]|uniref:hypothetical protein n=1 Tax=Streptomyces sp. B1866 TaxID=3075431 RepID=UPI002890CD7B|nr:hypothetical protein [Streptomyces sp. B1866]MDT3400509.1 hypothetical protein [Streptomyces sp. B1866]
MGDDRTLKIADEPQGPTRRLTVGGFARDDNGRVGEIMAVTSSQVFLRPKGGGQEWVRPADTVEPITAGEALRERVTEQNRRRRLGL